MDEYLGLFGVDIAVKKLRPGAEFAIYNREIIHWECPNNSKPPTWEEINKQIEADQAEAERLAFSESSSEV